MAHELPKKTISDDEQKAFLAGTVDRHLFRNLSAKAMCGLGKTEIMKRLNAIPGVKIGIDALERMLGENKVVAYEKTGERGPDKAMSDLLIPAVARILFHEGYGEAQGALVDRLVSHCERELAQSGSTLTTGPKRIQITSGVREGKIRSGDAVGAAHYSR